MRRLPGGEQLLFVKGTRPIRARKTHYLTDPEFARRRGQPLFDENPMHVASEVRENVRPVVKRRVENGAVGCSVEPAEVPSESAEWVFEEEDLPDFLRDPPRTP